MGGTASGIEELVTRLDQIADANSREIAHELMTAILALNSAGWQRLVEFVQQAGEPGQTVLRKMAEDNLTGGLLALYGLHPDSMESRVNRTLRMFDAVTQTTDVSDGQVKVTLHSGYGLTTQTGSGDSRRLSRRIVGEG